jgi:acylglycerol lipase
MDVIESKIKNSQNEEIHFYKYLAEEEKDVLMISHGLGEHGGRYDLFSEYFTQKGYSVYCHDHKGHGKSYGKRGHVDGFDKYSSDLDCMLEYIKKEHKIDKIKLVGHSLGAVIASYYATIHQRKISTLILSSAGFSPYKQPLKIKDMLGRFLADILPEFSMSNDLDLNYLSRDKSIIEKYKADPLVHDRVSARFYTSFLQAVDQCFTKANLLDIPVLVLLGTADKIVSLEKQREFYKHLSFEPKKKIEFPDSVHELFNDLNRDDVYSEVDSWLDEINNYYHKS